MTGFPSISNYSRQTDTLEHFTLSSANSPTIARHCSTNSQWVFSFSFTTELACTTLSLSERGLVVSLGIQTLPKSFFQLHLSLQLIQFSMFVAVMAFEIGLFHDCEHITMNHLKHTGFSVTGKKKVFCQFFLESVKL